MAREPGARPCDGLLDGAVAVVPSVAEGAAAGRFELVDGPQRHFARSSKRTRPANRSRPACRGAPGPLTRCRGAASRDERCRRRRGRGVAVDCDRQRDIQGSRFPRTFFVNHRSPLIEPGSGRIRVYEHQRVPQTALGSAGAFQRVGPSFRRAEPACFRGYRVSGGPTEGFRGRWLRAGATRRSALRQRVSSERGITLRPPAFQARSRPAAISRNTNVLLT